MYQLELGGAGVVDRGVAAPPDVVDVEVSAEHARRAAWRIY
jgi:hypothetical protein